MTTESEGRGAPADAVATYRDVLRSRWVLVSVATFLYWFAAHALRPLLALRLDVLGASEVTVGVVVALFPLASLGLAIPSGRFIDRVGLLRVLVGGYVAMALLGLLFTQTDSIVVFAALVAAIGIGELAVWVSLQALASNGGSGTFLTRQLAVFSLAWGGGVALGPIGGGLLYDRIGFGAVGVTYFACSALALVVVMASPRVPVALPRGAPKVSMTSGVAQMWQVAPVRVTLLSSFVVLFVYGIKASFLPLYLERAGLSVSLIGLLLSVIGVASLAIRVALPWVIERFGSGRTLMVSMWLSIIPMAAMPTVSGFAPWLALGILCGIGLGMNPPITVELMARHTAADQRGLAMGMRLTANRISQVLQPLFFGALIPLIGFAGAFLSAGMVLAGVTGWTHRVRAADPDLT